MIALGIFIAPRTGRAGLPCSAKCAAVDWFKARVEIANCGHDTPCWLWTQHVTPNGYGVTLVVVNGVKYQRAHRLAYAWLVGPIPEGLHIDHLCRVRRCVNPAHLEAVTQKENNRRSGAVQRLAERRKSHCCRGHAMEGGNIMTTARGTRACRACRSIYNRECRLRRLQRAA